MSLDLDICEMVLDHLDSPSDISAFMRSCKLFSIVGARRLLRQAGVTLRTAAHLDSFCHFMLRDLDKRATALHHLFLCVELRIADVDDTEAAEKEEEEVRRGAALLVRVLRRATGLQHLAIYFCEELLQRDEALVDALVSLEHVKQLIIYSYGIRAHDVITGIRSPLVHVNVDCYTSTEHDIDLAQTLARHRNTLETVTAWGVNLTAQFLARDGEHNGIVFPRVHALSIRSPIALDRAALMYAFPNVRTFEVAGVRLDARDPRVTIRQLVVANHRVYTAWSKLNHLCGDVYALFMLGLGRHAVRRVDVEWDVKGWDSLLAGPLIRARPTHLVLHWGFKGGDLDYWETVTRLLRKFTRDVTHLGIDLHPKSHELDDTMNPLVIVMKGLNLAFVAVRLRALPQGGRRSLLSIEGSDGEIEASELSDWVDKMAEASPALRYVSFDLDGHPPCYFQVLAPERGRELTVGLLDPHEGEAVVRKEGMEWRRREPEPPRFEERSIPPAEAGPWVLKGRRFV
ncbi:hypothetical protein VTO73DRAFT_4514 [Trametes versicolor]